MKHVEVEYIEKGTFQGGEDDAFIAEIEYGESCVVVKAEDWKRVEAALRKIAGYDSEPIWMDDRDDAADAMLKIARVALGEEDEEEQ